MVNLIITQEDIAINLRTWNVQGAIFLGMFDDEIELIYKVNNAPMVFVDSYSEVRQLSNVGVNDYKGGQLVAEHLLEKGYAKIAFVSPPTIRNGVVQHKLDGFLSVLKDNRLLLEKTHRFILESDVNPQNIVETGRQIAALKNELSAVFVTSDQIASYLVQGIKESGVKVPEDISVVGFDDMPIASQITPRLTTISQNL